MSILESVGWMALGSFVANAFFLFGYAVGLGLLKRDKHD